MWGVKGNESIINMEVTKKIYLFYLLPYFF